MARGEGGVDGEGRRGEARRMAASTMVHGDGTERGSGGGMRREGREERGQGGGSRLIKARGGAGVAWARGQRSPAGLRRRRSRAGVGLRRKIGDGATGELGWAAAWPGSWAGPVGGEGFFLNSDKQNKTNKNKNII